MQDKKGTDRSQVGRQMLVELKERLGRPLTTADVLMEYTDRLFYLFNKYTQFTIVKS